MFNFHRYDNNTKCVNKLNPRRVLYESKGDTIVSLLYAAAEGDMGNLRRYKVFRNCLAKLFSVSNLVKR